MVCRAESGAEVSLSAGELAELGEDGQFTVTGLTPEDVPAFIRAEVETDGTLAGAIPETTLESEETEPPQAPVDPMRLRDMYTYSKALMYSADGELRGEVEYFPDEQGRIAKYVTSPVNASADITTYEYNDAGALQSTITEINDSLVCYTVTEDAMDHRTMVREDSYGIWEVHYYYDTQGRLTGAEHSSNTNFDWIEVDWIDTYTYGADGKLIRMDRSSGGTSNGNYILYVYD